VNKSHVALLAGAFVSAIGAAAEAQIPLTPEMQAEGARLRAAITQLDQQWQAQTGQSLLSNTAPTAGYPTGANPAAQFQSALAQLQGGGGGAPVFYPTTPGQNGMQTPGFAAAGSPTRPGSDSILNRESSGTVEFSPAQIEGRDKIPVGYIAQGTVGMTVNSDSPGPWKGTLSQPILSIDKHRILFPVGSTVTGRVVRITGVNDVINNRLGLLPTYITRPDGASMKIRQQSVLDQLGINGIADEVNYHVWTMIAAIGATAVVQSAPTILSNETQQKGASQTFAGNFIGQGSYASENTFNRYLSLLPTITVHNGMPFRIFFSEEQFAPPIRQTDNFQLTNVRLHRTTSAPIGDSR